MGQGRIQLEWDQTALLWSLQMNINRDPKKQSKPFCPSMVHPLRSEGDYKPEPIEADITILKAFLRG